MRRNSTSVDSESRDQRLDRPLEIEEVELAAVGGAESTQRLPLARQRPSPGRSPRGQLVAGGKVDAGHLEQPDTVAHA